MMENYGIIGWIVIGGLAGAIAKLLMPGKDPGGCIITILLGIAGALLAGWLGHAVGWYEPNEGAGFIAAIVGAFLLLLHLPAGRAAAADLSRAAAVQETAMARARTLRRAYELPGELTMRTILLCALVLGAAALPAAASAQQATITQTDRRHAARHHRDRRSHARPDLAIISAGVVTRSATAGGALQEAADSDGAGPRALKRAGIDDRDIQTSNISLNPEYRYRRTISRRS